MDRFQLPDDITTLDDEALAKLLEDAVVSFDELSGQDTINQEDLAALRKLRDDIKTIKGEQGARIAAAEEAAAEIAALQNDVHADNGDGDDGGEGDGEGEGEGEGEAPEVESPDAPEAEAAGGEVIVPDEVIQPDEVAASASPKRPMNMRAIRSRQPAQKLPEPTRDRVKITAAADVPGLSIGQGIDIPTLVDGVTQRAIGLKSAKRPAQALVASYEMPFPEHLQVNDPTSGPEGSRAVMAASDQSRLPQGDLVASGGWCAPSETIYEIADISCPEMLWSAPEIQLRRGGIRYFLTPSLDVSSLTWIHTETDDIAGAEKPCFTIPCPDPVEVRCEAIGVCLESGILTERFFPELVGWYVRNSMVAHEIRISQATFLGAIAASTAITGSATMGAFTAVFGQVALQAADLVEKYSLCESIALEVTFPWWVRNAFLADIARQNGRSIEEIDPAIITRAFATLGVSTQFARGLSPSVPTDIGGTDPAAAWPAEVSFMIHPAGAFQIGRGAEVNLGAIYDSTKFTTNDYTALFTEECVALVNRGPESRFVTVPICPDGMTGGQAIGAALDCPIDAGTVES